MTIRATTRERRNAEWNNAQWRKYTTCEECKRVTHARRRTKRTRWLCGYCWYGDPIPDKLRTIT